MSKFVRIFGHLIKMGFSIAKKQYLATYLTNLTVKNLKVKIESNMAVKTA